MDYLKVETVFFTIIGYPMSYIEFFGTVFNLLSVYLVAKKNLWTWPVGLIAVVLFAILFYQIRLYGDFIEQIYYFAACVYGWWIWLKNRDNSQTGTICWSPKTSILGWLSVTFLGGCLFSWVLANLNIWAPQFFPEPTTYPMVDGFTTVASFVAMILMAHKRIECWIYWLVINVISVWLYYVKGVAFVSLLYGVFLVLAILGLMTWMRALPMAKLESR